MADRRREGKGTWATLEMQPVENDNDEEIVIPGSTADELDKNKLPTGRPRRDTSFPGRGNGGAAKVYPKIRETHTNDYEHS